jgi:hypothetical protein
MGAVRLVFGARWRCHWRAWLGLALLVALVSGLVMAAGAAGRRAGQAFPGYLARHGLRCHRLYRDPGTRVALTTAGYLGSGSRPTSR